MRWNTPSAGLVLFLFERSGRMGKVLIWFVIIISTVVLYCLMKVNTNIHEKIAMMKKEKLPEKVIERSGKS